VRPSHKPSSSFSTAGNLQVWSGQSAGTLQLSEYRDGRWAAATTIEDQAPEPGLGRLIVTDGETILAGVQGAAYVYRKQGLIWSRVGRLTPDAPVPDFGASVAILQSALVVAGADQICIFSEQQDSWKLTKRTLGRSIAPLD
jgi:hypothetical protein